MKQTWRNLWFFLGSLILAGTGILAGAANTNHVNQLYLPPKVEIRALPSIHLVPEPAATAEEEAKIIKLIGDLSEVQSPDFGISPTLSGDTFAPIPDTGRFESGLLMNHGLKPSSAVTELVKLGPKALPYLLASLIDSTPTKLVMKHDSFFGIMAFGNELSGNPGNDREQNILGLMPRKPFGDIDEEGLKSYTVKVGDVCFVIIGQIVGRPYRAVRYQPTACVVINSPVHDTKIAAQVRTIWSSPNPAQHLLDSLLIDYSSRGASDAQAPGNWYTASPLQVGAAMRLLYYFPAQSTNLIVQRLRNLDVEGDVDGRDATNGVRTDEFIQAVAWSKEPAIRAELQRIFRITDDPKILASTAGTMDGTNAAECQKRLEEFIAKLPDTEHGPFGTGYDLLVLLGQQFGDKARPAYQRYLDHASPQRQSSMCLVLERTHGDWSVDLLGPMLTDMHVAVRGTYAVVPGQNEPRLPIRICDLAAEAIAQNFTALKFTMAGKYKGLNQQIKKMRDQITRHDY